MCCFLSITIIALQQSGLDALATRSTTPTACCLLPPLPHLRATKQGAHAALLLHVGAGFVYYLSLHVCTTSILHMCVRALIILADVCNAHWYAMCVNSSLRLRVYYMYYIDMLLPVHSLCVFKMFSLQLVTFPTDMVGWRSCSYPHHGTYVSCYLFTSCPSVLLGGKKTYKSQKRKKNHCSKVVEHTR